MTDYAGFTVSTDFQLAVNNAHLSSEIDTLAVDYWPPHASAQKQDAASSPYVSPVSVTASIGTVAVSRPTSYFDDFYNRILIGQNVISPGYAGAHFINPVDVGNLLSTQVRPIEVWNAFMSPQLLSGITPANDSGITLTPETPGLPDTFGIFESRIFNAAVTTSGSPVIDAHYAFAFPTQTPVLYISGRRVVVFAFKPDWQDGITERLEWLTDVIVSRDGHEQRIALREIPRRFLEYGIVASRNEYGRLDVLLASWQSRVYAIPVWPDQGFLAADALAGDMALSLDTTSRDYHAGGLAVLIHDADNFESVEIASLTDSSLTLARPLMGSWPARTRIAPAHLARLGSSQEVTIFRNFLAQAPLKWEIMDNANVPAVDSAQNFQGIPFYVMNNNWINNLVVDYERIQERLDWDTGVVTVNDPAGCPFPVRKMKMTGSRADAWTFRAWLHARQGRLASFYSPTRDSLELIEPIAAADTSIAVRAHEEALYVDGLTGHTDLALQFADWTWSIRRVVGMSSNAVATTIAVDAAWGFDARISDIRRVCWLELVRLDADAVEIYWHHENLAEAAIATRGILQ